LALALALSLPFVIYFASPAGDALQAYQDALAAVVAFYSGTSSETRKRGTNLATRAGELMVTCRMGNPDCRQPTTPGAYGAQTTGATPER
jgi:hypothetical protein